MIQFTAIIKTIDQGKAILEVESCGEILVPVRFLPRGSVVGEKVFIENMNEKQFEARKKDIAKALLSEILGDNETQVSQKRTQGK